MTYTFTEKKRIRKDFGKRRTVLDVPYLLAIQMDSYREFLQEGASGDKREERGLHAALKSVFPISSYSGNAALEYVMCVTASGIRGPRVRGPGERQTASGKSLVLPAPARPLPLLHTGNSPACIGVANRAVPGTAKGRGLSPPASVGRRCLRRRNAALT